MTRFNICQMLKISPAVTTINLEIISHHGLIWNSLKILTASTHSCELYSSTKVITVLSLHSIFMEMEHSPNATCNDTWMELLQSYLIGIMDSDMMASLLSACDWVYVTWLFWVLYPIILSFILPFVLFVLIYASAIFLHLIHHRRHLQDAYTLDLFAGAKHVLAVLWSSHGRVWHGMYNIIP